MLIAPGNDPVLFAAQIARLYHDEALWAQLRENALARIRAEHRMEDFTATVAKVLQQT